MAHHSIDEENHHIDKARNHSSEQIIDERCEIIIDNNEMAAYLVLKPPQGGKLLDTKDIEHELKKKGVVFGIDSDTIKLALAERIYNNRILVARGKDAIDGADASVEFPFKHRASTGFNETDFHRIDFKAIKTTITVSKDDLLVVKTPATSGENGVTVKGRTVLAKKGRDVPVVAGKNTVISSDRLKITAAIEGQPLLKGNSVSVEPVLNILKNVDYSTGNVDFKGSVHVLGNVISGFSVKATQNIEIEGLAENCYLEAGGSINIKGGIVGGKKGVVKSGKDITLLFAENCYIEAGSKVIVGDVLNSEIFAGDRILAVSGNGRVVGSKLCAKNIIEANIFGSPTDTKTYLEVGHEPKSMLKLKNLQLEQAKNKNILQEINQKLAVLEEQKQTNGLSQEKKALYDRLNFAITELRKRIEFMSAEIEELEAAMSFGASASITARKKAYPNVHIKINNNVYVCTDELICPIFYENEGEIKLGIYR